MNYRKFLLNRNLYSTWMISKRNYIEFEPPYLNENKSSTPCYPLLNIQVKGYDFTILEKFARWIHNTANHLDVEVVDCWAAPGTKTHVTTYIPNSTKIDSEYDLQLYERNVQVEELPSTMAPILFQVIKAALPVGVDLSIHEHMQEHFAMRKVPDLELKTLKQQLDDIGGPRKVLTYSKKK